MVNGWFGSAGRMFEAKAMDFEREALIDIHNSNAAKEAAGLMDIVEVIKWYHNMIYVKLMRALEGELEERWECLDEFPKDSDGSAKVALIAIDRSIAAWVEMRTHFPEHEDEILDFLVRLERLRRKTENTFPNARAFIRPGFDNHETERE